MQIERPLDFLNNVKGKKVFLKVKGGREFSGTLLAFDIHINIVLENAKEIGKEEKQLGLTFFRGDIIELVSPA